MDDVIRACGFHAEVVTGPGGMGPQLALGGTQGRDRKGQFAATDGIINHGLGSQVVWLGRSIRCRRRAAVNKQSQANHQRPRPQAFALSHTCAPLITRLGRHLTPLLAPRHVWRWG